MNRYRNLKFWFDLLMGWTLIALLMASLMLLLVDYSLPKMGY